MNCAGVFVGAFLIPFVVLSRGIWLSTIFALCDVAEPIIIAGLIARYFGVDFALDQLRKVFGFLGAAIAGIIPSLLAGAVDRLPHSAGASGYSSRGDRRIRAGRSVCRTPGERSAPRALERSVGARTG